MRTTQKIARFLQTFVFMRTNPMGSNELEACWGCGVMTRVKRLREFRSLKYT